MLESFECEETQQNHLQKKQWFPIYMNYIYVTAQVSAILT